MMFDEDQAGLNALTACRDDFSAAENALAELQRKLGTIEGWRASTAWECIERALNELSGEDMWDVWELPSKPANFTHWREKYVQSADHML